MATADKVTVTEDENDLFSDETGDELVKREGSFSFDVKSAKTDLTLLVEDKKIYVTRVTFETISPAFEKIVSEQLLDGEKNEVRIHNKNFEDFVEFLACIYPGKMHEVTSTNVFKVLPLAFEYDVEFLKRTCESVLITEMSKPDVDESRIVRCANAAISYPFAVRQLGLDEIVKRRLKEIENSDEQLPLDIEGKAYVYENILPSLRSEACKYRYLSAERTRTNSGLSFFTDARYKRLEFQLNISVFNVNFPSYEIFIWDRKCEIDVKQDIRSKSIDVTLTIFKDKKQCSHFLVAFKVFVRNNDSECPKEDFCIQKFKLINESLSVSSSTSMGVSLQRKEIVNSNYRANGVYTIDTHILMNKPVKA